MTLMERGSAERLPRESAYTPELGRAVCERVAEGVSLTALGQEPGLPERSTLYKWAAAYPDFAEKLGEAMRAVRVARRMREQSATAVKRSLQLLNPRGNGGRASCRYTREIAAAICERLAEGESLMAICRDPEAPHIATVYNWLNAFPEFQDQYVEARQRQAETLMDEVREVGLGVTKETAWADRLRFDTLRWLTARLAPKKYCEKVMVVEAMAEARADAFAAAHAPRQIMVVHFERGPNNEILVVPPRNAEEADAWERAYGRPYDGPEALQTVADFGRG